MKIDVNKFIIFIWMCFVGYITYKMFLDLSYITELIEAYLQMVMQQIRK